MSLVRIDCATQDAKIGVAFGSFSKKTLTVLEAFACTKEKTAAIEISKWLQEGEKAALLATDAPLGWPQPLSRVLATHRAGEELRANAHDMFRRATDIFIKQKTGKTPLDVGADRIARTANAALCLLRDIRSNLNLARSPLAWEWPPAELISATNHSRGGAIRSVPPRGSGWLPFDSSRVREHGPTRYRRCVKTLCEGNMVLNTEPFAVANGCCHSSRAIFFCYSHESESI